MAESDGDLDEVLSGSFPFRGLPVFQYRDCIALDDVPDEGGGESAGAGYFVDARERSLGSSFNLCLECGHEAAEILIELLRFGVAAVLHGG